jgi:hypothetical protein
MYLFFLDFAQFCRPNIFHELQGWKAIGAPDRFAAVFTAMLLIELEGIYDFFTTSDDGSKMFIDNIQVVDNDGVHETVKKGGRMRLTKGVHFVKITFFEQGGGAALKVTYKGPDTESEIAVLGWLPPSAPNEPPPPPPLDSAGVEETGKPAEGDAPDAAAGSLDLDF